MATSSAGRKQRCIPVTVLVRNLQRMSLVPIAQEDALRYGGLLEQLTLAGVSERAFGSLKAGDPERCHCQSHYDCGIVGSSGRVRYE